MKIIDKQYIRVKCLTATQPIGQMYVAVIDSEDLEKITYADVRRLRDDSENREVEDYIGIQRKLDNRRAEREIGKYINLIDATFPNSIILSVSSNHVKFIEGTNELEIEYKDDIAKVLDGQHRIAGFEYYQNVRGTFQLIVTIYVDMELEDQAIVFATINKEQKGVNKSLVADLYAFAKSRSPQKTGHNIARALNAKEGSPFYKKIKILGTANNSSETITQSTFVTSLLNYISRDPQSDRDFYRRFQDKKDANLPYVEGKEEVRYFLRNIFIDDPKDINIAQLIWNYFYAIEKKWSKAWNDNTNTYILNKSTGFIALMRFFKDVYLSFGRIGEVISKEDFEIVFETINIDENSFVKEVYIPGSTGQGKLYRDLLESSNIE